MIQLNGVEIQMPTNHGWRPRSIIDTNGIGFPVYSDYRSYDMSFSMLSPEEFTKLQSAYEACVAAGGCSATLPYYVSGTYAYHQYQDVIIQEPKFDKFFMGYYYNASLLITGIQ